MSSFAKNNYVVFDNIEELNKDDTLESSGKIGFEFPNELANEKYIGNHRIIWKKHRKIIFTLGPHWPFFLFMFLILTGGGIATIIYVTPKYGYPWKILTILITFCELGIYFLTALRNPGILPPNPARKSDLEEQNKHSRICQKCGAFQNTYVYHCIDCDVCIEGYDHHCVWTGKCIGKGNLVHFYLFLIFTVIFLVYSIFLAVFMINKN